MHSTSYNIRSAAFQPESAHQYELSILTGMDSFAYMVRDRAKNTLLAYRSLALAAEPAGADAEAVTLESIRTTDPLLHDLQYGSVVLGWDTEKMALVPRELYAAQHRRDYLEQLTLIGLDDAVREEWSNELDAHLLFVVSQERLETVSRDFNVLRAQHYAGGLLSAWGNRSQRLGKPSVSLALRGGKLFVAVHRAGSLQYCNAFRFGAKEDVLYYVLLAYEHCGMLPARVPLYVCGELTAQSELYRLLYTYVQDIQFCVFPAPPQRPAEFTEVPAHAYFDLLCLR